MESPEETDSPSSLLAEPPTSESQDQILPNENEKTDKRTEEERKLRRLERRKALALARSPQAPKLGANANNTIDLTNEDDDPSNRWFKKTFNAEHIPKKVRSPDDAKKFAVPRTISKNAPKSLLTRETLQNKLKASMSAKRRKAQEERRKMYEEDNEHLKAGSEEEEEEEEVVVRKKKVKKPAEDDYDSEDDEDYKPPENSDDEEEKQDDEMSVNLLNDSFTYDVFNNAKRSGPGSIVSNFDTESQDGLSRVPTMSQMFGAGRSNEEDLLEFCSGRFEETQKPIPDTLQMLLDEGKPKKSAPEPVEDEEEEETIKTKRKKKSQRILDSDDDEDDVEETSEVQQSLDVFAESETVTETLQETVTELHLTRVVISGDEDSESEEEEDAADEEEEDPEEDTEEEPEEEDIPEPNFDDEDDELAVLKRIEHQEFKKQIKKRTLFDDEASLSGDDVGSDLEDEEGVENVYEAEEGDADDVPDDATIRRQNFKMLLKQENDKETRALAKLQEKLLADGDLGGVETNRQFRFKLREEVEINMSLNNMDDDQQQEEEEEEEDEEKKKERAEMIKYRIEHAEELANLEHCRADEDDAMFRRAGNLMKRVEVEEGPKTLSKPSLLSKTALAVSFQEVLSGGGAAPKQMYVQNFDRASESSKSKSGALKRPSLASPNQKTAAKRVRSSKLSSLE